MPTLDGDYAKKHEQLRNSLLDSFMAEALGGSPPSPEVKAEQKRLSGDLDDLFKQAHRARLRINTPPLQLQPREPLSPLSPSSLLSFPALRSSSVPSSPTSLSSMSPSPSPSPPPSPPRDPTELSHHQVARNLFG